MRMTMTRKLLAAGLAVAAVVSALAWGSRAGSRASLPSSRATYLIFQPNWYAGCGSSSILVRAVDFVWGWNGPTCPNLGIPVGAYNAAYRFTWENDTTAGVGNKDIRWAFTNKPSLVEYTRPVLAVTGNATNRNPIITALSINPTLAAGVVASTTSGVGTFVTGSSAIPGGSEIQSMSSSSITLNRPATATGKITFDLYTPAWNGTDYKDWPVNFTDSAWRTFLFKSCTVTGVSNVVGCSLKAEIGSGFPWIEYDNLLLNNQYAYVGHFQNASGKCAQGSWPKCGGVWHQDFTGANYGDHAWIEGVLNYLRYSADYVHGDNANFAINLGISNGGGGLISPTIFHAAAHLADAVLTEAGGLLSSGACNYGDQWLQELAVVRGMMTTLLYDEDSGNFTSASPPRGKREQCILATLMMMANSKPDGTTNTYFAVQGTADAGTVVHYDQSWLSGENCGPALPNNPPHINSGGSYERDFPADKCIAVYNPHAGTTTTWTPPKGETFTDFLTGGTYTGGTRYHITAPSGAGYGSLFIRISKVEPRGR